MERARTLKLRSRVVVVRWAKIGRRHGKGLRGGAVTGRLAAHAPFSQLFAVTCRAGDITVQLTRKISSALTAVLLLR